MTPLGGEMVGSYDHLLVVLSIVIAVLASYTALNLVERVTVANGGGRLAWLICGTIVMGIGIWSMHYAAMMAFSLPVPIEYDWPTALLSLLLGIGSSYIALFLVSWKRMVWGKTLAAGSLFQGGAIAGLHYTAMASMRLMAICHYSPPVVVLSVLVAIGGSLLSLRLAFQFRFQAARQRFRKVASAILMGAAISSMHYTGMAAASFTASDKLPDLSHAVRITTLGTVAIVTVPIMVLVGTIVTTLVDRLRERGALLDELFEQAPEAIALMDAEHRLVRVNREFTRIFGFTAEEAVGRGLIGLIAPGESPEQVRQYPELVSTGQREDSEAVRRRKDGSELHVSVVSVPVSMPGGQIAVYVMYRDITGRKAAETALRSLSSRLLEVQETERRHLARELHDEIGQSLTGLRLLLRANGDWSAEAVKTRFDQARTIVDDLLSRIRGLSFDLRPAALDQLGLLPALLALFDRFTSQTGVLVDFKQTGVSRRFASEVETAAYRIVQEALTNTARHAGVAGVAVRAWVDADRLNLQIEDQGCGFDPELVLKEPKSSGLAGLQERSMLLGGRTIIESSPGSGTTITAEMPLGKSGRG